MDQLYSDSQILMLIVAGEVEMAQGHDADPRGPKKQWTFQLLELFKGTPGFKKLWSRGHEATCGVSLNKGEQYLVSSQPDGKISQCSSARMDKFGFTTARVNALRSALADPDRVISEPVLFLEYDGGCRLFHQLANGGARLNFVFRTKKPERIYNHQYQFDYPDSEDGYRIFTTAKKVDGFHVSTQPGYLALQVTFPRGKLVKKGTGHVSVGKLQWATHRTLMEAAYSNPYEVVEDVHTREILRTMETHREIAINWSYQGLANWDRFNYPGYPEATSNTPSIYFGSALDQFKACINDP
ncbi:MAG: hypothetical protein HKO64_07165 [Xanthomonadales bacterium]|nr:hypothetical protein [Xanthomonadales bacterium]